MDITVAPASVADIASLRKQFLAEANRQIVQHARFQRGWADCWLVSLDGTPVGYGATTGELDERPRARIFEFFLLDEHRDYASDAFAELVRLSGATTIRCQSNDPLLFAMFERFATDSETDALLFEAGPPASHALVGARFRPRNPDEATFEHKHEPVGDYVVEIGGEIVGTAGWLTHYNPPFADIYMEVSPAWRRKGIGRYLVQETMRACAANGYIPAARTGPDNIASRAALLSAGLRSCGSLLLGPLPQSGVSL
jgi:GNAT superfamily N-acetyltransferase